jgi:thioredoxin reductase
MSTPPIHIAILGAGPIGLEAALAAVQLGFDVTVYERSHCVAAHIRDWGHVRMFSPFGMNSSERGRAALRQRGHRLPGDDDLLTGDEFCDAYLEPLSRLPELDGRIAFGTSVFRIGRNDSLKTERIGDPARAAEPFRIVLLNPTRVAAADIVLDCTGTYGQHNWLGRGGIPCPGEVEAATAPVRHGAVTAGPGFEYRLPRILGAPGAPYGNRTTLVIGSGYSAATNVIALSLLQVEYPETRVIWLTRRNDSEPIRRISEDPLSERDRIAAEANALATSGRGPVTWMPGCSVRSMQWHPEEEQWSIQAVREGESCVRLEVDCIIANVGFRPDRSIYEELHVHECYATQGPMQLAARLLGETSADCLAQTSHGADVLRNPEPNFFILGSKSYGRRNDFLLRIGLEQVTEVLTLLGALRPV